MLAPGGRVVLLDFGIARIEQVARPGATVSGSPHFMAPEVIRGCVRRGEAHKVDLYALGVIAFMLFTGRTPFDADDPVEVLVKQLEDPPPPLAPERPDLPATFCRTIDQMLAKPPEDRPERIELVVEALRLVARHPALPPSRVRKVTR
jgi:serine/threonine-protein kinase